MNSVFCLIIQVHLENSGVFFILLKSRGEHFSVFTCWSCIMVQGVTLLFWTIFLLLLLSNELKHKI